LAVLLQSFKKYKYFKKTDLERKPSPGWSRSWEGLEQGAKMILEEFQGEDGDIMTLYLVLFILTLSTLF